MNFFRFFITFCIGFTRTDKKYVKVIHNDICNRKIEFKAKIKLTKRNRNYKKVDKKILRVLNFKEIVALRGFLYKVWFVQFGIGKLFLQIIRTWKLLFRSVGTYFSFKVLCLQRKPVFRLIETSFFYLSEHPW